MKIASLVLSNAPASMMPCTRTCRVREDDGKDDKKDDKKDDGEDYMS